tara:strand:- start:212 stop:706 length:495 start_codon:yes stop_codon:yes gene_type:complete
LAGPHIDIVSIIEQQQPPACAFLAQVSLHEFLSICFIVIRARDLELSGDIEIRLMKTFHVSRRYPDDRAILKLVSDAVDECKRQLGLSYSSKPPDCNFCRSTTDVQLFFNLSKLGLTTREFGVPVEWYDEWNVVGLLSLVSVAQPIDHLPGYCRMMHTAYSCTV